MRIFQSSYKDQNGKTRKTARYYIEFRDHLSTIRRLPAFTDKRASEALGRQVERLTCCRAAGEQPDRAIMEWLEQTPQSLRNSLARIGLIDAERAAGGKPLKEHLEDYKQNLLAKANTSKHAEQVFSRIERLITDCKFIVWSDISASKVQRHLSDMRNNGDGISIQTSNYYLASLKAFLAWMVQDRRTNENPLIHLKALNAKVDRRHERRALSVDELRLLLEKTEGQPNRFNMTGSERAMLYRLAVETGLRAGELRSLTVSSFDLEGLKIKLEAAYSKHRREDILPLRTDTAQQLQAFLAGKMPGTTVFRMPSPSNVVRMFRKDLEAAGISYRDESGKVIDFHSLRHTTASLLAATGVNPKVAQALLRHSTVELTLGRYSHLYKGQESDAVASLPDLSLPSSQSQKALKTGTDDSQMPDENEDSRLALYLAHRGRKQHISVDNHRQTNPSGDSKTAFLMGRAGVEPATHGFSVRCSTS